MQVIKSTLQNGLRVLTVPMPSLESATITVWVGVGSRFENQKVSGISHFLEHMVFKGGQKYKTAQEISSAVDAMGAEFNAATSQEWTNFYIRARVGLLDQACEVLADMLLTPQLRPEDISRESGVIVEELNMYEDNPMYKIGNLFQEVVFEGNPLSWDIGGTKETVKSIKHQDFIDFRQKYYHPSNIVITVAGNVDKDKVFEIASKYFGKLGIDSYKREFDGFSISQSSPRSTTAFKKIEQAHLIVGFFGNKMGSEDRFTEEVLSVILGGGMSSRLFSEVREKRGLAYSVRTSVDNFLDTGTISTYAAVDPGKAREALEVILEGHRNLTDSKIAKISAEELSKAKEYIKGHIALSLENTSAVDSFFGHQEILLGKTETPEEVFDGIDKVSVEDITSLANDKFTKTSLNLAVVGPFEDGNEFQKVLQSQ